MDELTSKNASIRKFGERAAINAPMQGTASDVVKLAMIGVFNQVTKDILLQVHDELLVEVNAKDARDCGREVKRVMEGAIQLKVPLKVEVSIGKNWAEAHA